MNNLVIYNNGEIELKVSVNKKTIWLTQSDLVELFKKDQSVISRHIKNIFKDKEVDKKSNMQKMHIPNSDKPVTYYSLDIVLAVGYRTNSSRAIKFRQWATKILKNYIYEGYVINSEKITNQRFKELENDVRLIKQKIEYLENSNIFEPKQGIFFDGQIFDAYVFINNLIKKAKKSIRLIDRYIDESIFVLFSKIPNINVKIYTKINKRVKLDFEKYKKQYQNVEIINFKLSHDRFLIIDDKELYHIGASLKDLGKKWFAFTKIEFGIKEILGEIKKNDKQNL